MRILYHFRTQGTGAEGVHIAGIAEAFEALGHEVIFSSPTGIDPRQSAGRNPFAGQGGNGTRRGWLAGLARLARGPLFEVMEIAYNAVAWWRNRRLLRECPCDMIYERHAFFLFSTAWLARRRGLSLVVEVNELAGDERVRAQPFAGAWAAWSDRFVFRSATVIVVVSPHLRRSIEAMGIPGAKILVLPNGVSESSLDRPSAPEAFRRRFQLAEARPLLSFVGWFVPWHRLDRLIDVFATLAEEFPAARLVLVGDGPLRGELQRQVAAAGLEGRVLFTGALPHGEIPDVLAASEISIVPHGNAYRSPIKLFEAMAAGCAVLAPAVEPIAAILRNGENGVLFEPESSEDLRRCLARLISDAQFCQRLGTVARAEVRERYTWRRNAVEVLRLSAVQDR